jgi:hypothetical protein
MYRSDPASIYSVNNKSKETRRKENKNGEKQWVPPLQTLVGNSEIPTDDED